MSSMIALLVILAVFALPIAAVVYALSNIEWGEQGIGKLNQPFDDFASEMRRRERERSPKN